MCAESYILRAVGKRFFGRTALVTGASRGIGAAVALLLAEQGADVAVNFRSKESRAKGIASQVRGLGQRALLAQAVLTDATVASAIGRASAHTFGRLYILMLNACASLD